MKTFNQFAEEKEATRRNHLRPGQEGFNASHQYIGIFYDDKERNYTFQEGPEITANHVDFATAANLLCDSLIAYSGLRFDINVSEDAPEQERRLIRRIAEVLKERAELYKEATDSSREAANLRPQAVRAAHKGLTDKFS
jgi:hypothetical protein